MFSEIRRNFAHKNMQVFFYMVIKKKCSKQVFYERTTAKIHRNMKIPRDSRAVKLSCSN